MKAAAELNIGNTLGDIAQWIGNPSLSAQEMGVLSHHLTVGETYFFREKTGLKLFSEKILPALVAEKASGDRQLKFWSAGCSSGEEPYTLAMIIRNCLPQLKNWNITILATDVNPSALQKARKGIYSAWSFREIPPLMKTKYFTAQGKLFEIKPEIKKMVQFDLLNLATDDFPNAKTNTLQMDAIFCRNVLMYLSPETILKTAHKFFHSLRNDGWFITSQVELNTDYFGMFNRTVYENGIFYQKTTPTPDSPEHSTFVREFPVKRLSPSVDKRIKTRNPAIKVPSTTSNGSTKAPFKQRSPEKPEISPLTKAHTLFHSSHYEACINHCNIHLETSGFDPEIAFVLAEAYANTGRLAEAERIVSDLLSQESTHTGHHLLNATLMAEQNRWKEADQSLQKILYLDPMHLRAILARGQVLKHLGNTTQLQREMNRLLTAIKEYDDDELVTDMNGLTAGTIREMAMNYLTR